MGAAAGRMRRRSVHRLSPPQLFVLSFAGLVTLGTLGLRLLPGLYVDERLGWLESFFTATSAVCVTGLIVVDTATYFTLAGQLFLLALIQLGGLGMIAFTTVIILALGRRLSLRTEAISHGTSAEVAPDLDFSRLGRDVLRFTFAIEDDFHRMIRAANFETDANTNRDINRLRLLLGYQPRDHSISGYLYYLNVIDIFESDEQAFANRMTNQEMLDG